MASELEDVEKYVLLELSRRYRSWCPLEDLALTVEYSIHEVEAAARKLQDKGLLRTRYMKDVEGRTTEIPESFRLTPTGLSEARRIDAQKKGFAARALGLFSARGVALASSILLSVISGAGILRSTQTSQLIHILVCSCSLIIAYGIFSPKPWSILLSFATTFALLFYLSLQLQLAAPRITPEIHGYPAIRTTILQISLLLTTSHFTWVDSTHAALDILHRILVTGVLLAIIFGSGWFLTIQVLHLPRDHAFTGGVALAAILVAAYLALTRTKE